MPRKGIAVGSQRGMGVMRAEEEWSSRKQKGKSEQNQRQPKLSFLFTHSPWINSVNCFGWKGYFYKQIIQNNRNELAVYNRLYSMASQPNRLTATSKNFTERCTIPTDPGFKPQLCHLVGRWPWNKFLNSWASVSSSVNCANNAYFKRLFFFFSGFYSWLHNAKLRAALSSSVSTT